MSFGASASGSVSPSVSPVSSLPSPSRSTSALAWRQPTRCRPAHPRWTHLDAMVQHLAFFRTLPTHIVRRLMLKMTMQYLPMEAYVFQHGDTSAFMAIILKGEVSVLSPAAPGSNRLDSIATLTAADAFGAQSLLDGAPRNTSVICMVECELAVLTRRDYLEVLMYRHEEESDIEAAEQEDDDVLLSLLDPEFIPASALPTGFVLAPHLQNYIDILTKQQAALLEEQRQVSLTGQSVIDRRKSLTSSLGALALVGSATQAVNATLASAAAIFFTVTPSNDAAFLLNLLKTAKHIQMHDRRPVLLELTRKMTLHHYPPNSIIYERGSPATYSYFILSGSVAEMAHTSYAHRNRARLDRRARRQAVREIVSKWEDQDKKDAAEEKRRKEERPAYMATTASQLSSLEANADLIAQVQFSASAKEKESDRRERARLAAESRQSEIQQAMREHGIDTLESSDDDEDNHARERAVAAASATPQHEPHQFPLGSCRSVRLYPEHVGWTDVEAHLRVLQTAALDACLAQSKEFAQREVERAQIIRAAAKKGVSYGSGEAASAAANRILEEEAKERVRIAEQKEMEQQRILEERQHRAKAGLSVEAAKRRQQLQRSRANSPERGPLSPKAMAPMSPMHGATATMSTIGSSVSTSSSSACSARTPVYLSQSFSQVTHSSTCVARESCWVARLPNTDILVATESPYHGPEVVERLNDPVLRYTVRRPTEHRPPAPPERIDPNDPDAGLIQLKQQSGSEYTAGNGRLDYSHHIENLFASMQHLKFFSIQNRELGLKLCARMRYLSLKKGDVLCKQGQLGSLFYIVLSGSIAIHIMPQFVVPDLNKILAQQEERNRRKRGAEGGSAAAAAGGKAKKDKKGVSGSPVASKRFPLVEKRGSIVTLVPSPAQGSVMVQSLMFPSTSPVDQMKRQEKDQKEGEAAAAAAAGAGPTKEPQKQGSVMIQSLMFPSTSPVEQMKRQERDQKEGEAAQHTAAADGASVRRNSLVGGKLLAMAKRAHAGEAAAAPPPMQKQGSVMIQSLMFPSTSPVEQMKRQERDQREGEEALKKAGTSAVEQRPHILDGLHPDLSKLKNPQSRIARHLQAPFSSIDELRTLESLYGPCVKVAVSGDPIGESAIVSSNPRSATCICREPVELFTLSKEDYRAIYATPQHLKVNTIINLLHKSEEDDGPTVATAHDDELPPLSKKDIVLLEHCIRDIEFFRPLHPSIRNILGQRLHHMQLEAGRVVVEQGTQGHYLYIIISGTCSVYVKPPAAVAPVVDSNPTKPKVMNSRMRSRLMDAGLAKLALSDSQVPPTVTVDAPDATETPSPLPPTIQQRVRSAARDVLSVKSSPRSAAPPAGSLDPQMESNALDLSKLPDPTEVELAAHRTIDAMEAELEASLSVSNSGTPGGATTPNQMSLHKRSHRTASNVMRAAKALQESVARPGAEMLSSGKAAFKFSSGATVGAAAGGGRAFSAGRIKPAQLQSHPPCTEINLSEQEAAYLQGLGPVSSILSTGTSFGESGLKPGEVQAATVVTNGPTDLLLLTRASYTFALESLAQWQSDMDEVLTFLKTSHFFRAWSPSLMSKAMSLMERKEIKRNEVIISQGAPASHIYFILKGELHETRAVQLADQEVADIVGPTEAHLFSSAAGKKSKKHRHDARGGGGADESKEMFDHDELDRETSAAHVKPAGRPKSHVTIQSILREIRDDESVSDSPKKGPPRSTKTEYPIRTANDLVGTLARPAYGLPLFVPTITHEDAVPLVFSPDRISNISALVTAGQAAMLGLDPTTPIVDGGQIWVHFPQKLDTPYATVASGCMRRGVKKVYRNTANNGTEVALKKGAMQSAGQGDSAGVGIAATSPVFPFHVELSSLSRHGICGSLETLLPTILGVRELLGRPETEEELARERERKEREAYAIESGQASIAQGVGLAATSLPAGTQCQLVHPSTFTAVTDCTLVAFPTNAFHHLLSLSEETAFYAVYLDRLHKTHAKIRRTLESRLLASNPPFTRDLLEDFRIFEENLQHARQRRHDANTPVPTDGTTAIGGKDRMNVLLRPGVKPPALVDYKVEEQLRELKAAGLANHPYTLNLEQRAAKSRTTAASATSMAASEIDHDLSFSVAGNMADHTYAAIFAQYRPAAAAHLKGRTQQARSLLDTICQVSHDNASVTSVQSIAATYGKAPFDPLKSILPSAAAHTPEFQAALRFAEKRQQLQMGAKRTPEPRLHKEPTPTLGQSQSLPFLSPAAKHHPSARSLSPIMSPQSIPALSGSSTPTSLRSSPTAQGSPLLPALGTPTHGPIGDWSDELSLPLSNSLAVLSSLSSESHSSKFFSKSLTSSQRNLHAAAGLVHTLLKDTSHDLEQFLAHVKSNDTSEAPTARMDSPTGAKSRTFAQATARMGDSPSMKGRLGDSSRDSPSRTVPSTPTGSQYAMKSAVQALQAKSSEQIVQRQQQVAFVADTHARRRQAKSEATKQHARAIARALCLPDPFAADSAGQWTAGHIEHLQRVVRGEIPDTRPSHQRPSPLKVVIEEAKTISQMASPSHAQIRSPVAVVSSTPERRGILLPEEPSGWEYNKPTTEATDAQSVLAYSHSHKRLKIQAPMLHSSASAPVLLPAATAAVAAPASVAAAALPSSSTVPARPSVGRSSVDAIGLLHSALSAQDHHLASGGSMSTEVLRRSHIDRANAALVEEAEIAKQLGVAPDLVHAHAGHAAISIATNKRNRASTVADLVHLPNGAIAQDGAPTDALLAMAAARGMAHTSAASVAPVVHNTTGTPMPVGYRVSTRQTLPRHM